VARSQARPQDRSDQPGSQVSKQFGDIGQLWRLSLPRLSSMHMCHSRIWPIVYGQLNTALPRLITHG
jgi:hypothetical protein